MNIDTSLDTSADDENILVVIGDGCLSTSKPMVALELYLQARYTGNCMKVLKAIKNNKNITHKGNWHELKYTACLTYVVTIFNNFFLQPKQNIL